MAAPSYATDLDDIYTDGGSWTILTGRATDPDTDDYIQGASCWSHDPFSTGIEGGVVNSAETVATDDAVFVWTKADISPALATHAAGGIQVLIGASSSALDCFYVRGSDDYIYGGWICIPVDPTFSPSTTIGGGGTGTSYFGVRWNVPGSGPSKGYPFKIDAIRHGRQLEVTAGDSGTPATWDATAVYDSNNTRQWGICQPTDTGAALQGLIYWGTGSTAVYSRDSNRTIVLIDTEWTVSDFTQILFAHASNDVEWNNVGLLALGTSNRGIIDVTANGAITWTNSVFQDIDTTTLLSGSTFDGSKWLSTNEVDAGGASLVNCKILTPTVAASSHGLLWDVATDTDGLLDGMEFSKGTNSHHAIELGTNTPSDITLNDWTVSGFNASHAQTDSTIYNNSGKAITINIVGGTGDFSYLNGTSASTILVIDPITTTITVKDIDTQAVIEDARVFLVASDDTGDLPFEESVTEITRSGSTATVDHTGHGMTTGDFSFIEGADQDEYNGAYEITVTGVDDYTYTVPGTPTTPATGTIIATGGYFNTLTNASGIVTDSRTISADQPLTGRVRLSTSPDYYKNSPLNLIVDSVDGRAVTVQLIPD